MIFDVINTDRAKSPKTNMQCYKNLFAANIPNLLQKFFGKMQSGSWCCSTAILS